MSDRYRLVGAEGSPYSMKLRAILRYRHIAHDWVLRTPRVRAETAHVRPQIIPMLRDPDGGDWQVDSSPIAHDLERRHGGRSIVPDDPGLAFLSALIEDFADEWLTKAMFHYRWACQADIDYASRWIVSDWHRGDESIDAETAARQIAERQIARMPLVGCTPQNAPIIERTYHRVLEILDGHVGNGVFLFGGRPALADFGLFGQLKTLSQDPTPQAIMRDRYQRVFDWVRRADDLSGIDGDWIAPHKVPDAVRELLRLIAETYLPFLIANRDAFRDERDTVALIIWDRPYSQAPFRYQVKCLDALQKGLARLDGDARARTAGLLAEAGCLAALEDAS